MDLKNGADAWERWSPRAEGALPHIGLALSLLLSLVAHQADWPSLPVTAGIAGLAALWVLVMFTTHPDWMSRPTVATIGYAGLLVFAGVLAWRAPWFGIFAFCGYVYLDHLPPRLIGVGVFGTALVSATAQIGGYPTLRNVSAGILTVWGALFAFNFALAGAFVYTTIRKEALDAERATALTEVTAANERLEAAIAENAGLRAQLLAWAREAGVRDERQRMAREIHDTIAQGLIGIVTQLEAAQRAEDLPDRWRRHLGEASKLARGSLTEARRSVQALRPQPLEDARLPDALREVTAQWSDTSGVAATVRATGTARPLHPEVETAMLRTTQEALANVAKHAGAGRVGVTLSYMEDVVSLDVRDDGRGFDPATRPALPADPLTGGFGLTAMRQRLDLLAGTLTVESEPGTGTAISATVPAIPAIEPEPVNGANGTWTVPAIPTSERVDEASANGPR